MAATGELQNADAVLPPAQRERFNKARTASAPVLIVTQEEASYYASLPQWGSRQLQISKIAGLNTADPRYILCSKSVTPEVMQKINTAIDKLLPKP